MGSWIGRSVLALPAALAAVAAGVLVIGVTGRAGPGFAVMAVLAAGSLVRVARTGVTIDLDRQQVRLTTFWRTHHVPIGQLALIDTQRPVEGPPSVRFVTDDGRELTSTALLGSSDDQVDHFLELLTEAREGAGFEVRLDRSSFRPSAA